MLRRQSKCYKLPTKYHKSHIICQEYNIVTNYEFDISNIFNYLSEIHIEQGMILNILKYVS